MTQFSFFRYFVFAMIFVGVVFANNVFAANNGILSVTNISAVKTYATADGIFENGWQWVFDVTVPYNETILKMKFADWSGGTNAIPAADNIRFYSAQSTDANSASTAVIISNAGQYSAVMNINPESASDLDFAKAGRQIKIIVEARVPKGSAGGSYSTSYGIFTDVDENIEVSNPGQNNSIKVEPNSEFLNQIIIEEGGSFNAADFYIIASGSTMQVDQIVLEFNDDPQKYFGDMIISVSEQSSRQRLVEQNDIKKIDENRYTLTIWTDFSVSENTARRLRILLATKNYVDSDQMPTIIQIGLPTQGVRSFDRFGNYYYSDAPLFLKNVIINRSYASEADVALRKNSNSPLSRNIIADSSGTINGASLLSFDVKTTKGVLIFDALNNVSFETGDQYLIPEGARLIDDQGLVLSFARPDSEGKLNFTNFDSFDYVLPKDSTKTFSIAIDDKLTEDDNGKIYRVNVDSSGIVATKYDGAMLGDDKKSGSAVSSDAYVYTAGPVFTLSNVVTTSTQSSTSASSTISATFTVNVGAKGGDVYMVADGQLGNGTVYDAFNIKTNNTNALAHAKVAYQKPSGVDQANNCGGASVVCYKIAQDTSATFNVTATYVLDSTAGNYYLNVANIYWDTVKAQVGTANTEASTYMATDWLSNAVFLQ